MAKNNIRSIRFSDDLAELIDRQAGETFTQKFENLVTHCVYELPKKEAEIKRLDAMIDRKQQELRAMQEKYSQMTYTLNRIEPQIRSLEAAIGRELRQWDSEQT